MAEKAKMPKWAGLLPRRPVGFDIARQAAFRFSRSWPCGLWATAYRNPPARGSRQDGGQRDFFRLQPRKGGWRRSARQRFGSRVPVYQGGDDQPVKDAADLFGGIVFIL